MDVTRLQRLVDFEPFKKDWQELAAGQPMRGWHWQSTWWMHYGENPAGPRRDLLTLVVFDGPHVIAIAPWLLDHTAARGRVIRFLGEDEVCTDYPTILCRAADRERATAALADYLASEFTSWDVLELVGVERGDPTVHELVAQLAERGYSKFARQEAFRCWRLPLPTTWEEYLKSLSKSQRTRVRRREKRVISAGELGIHRVTDAAEFEEAWQVLVELHQRRRRSLGEPGCFAWPRFAAFHQAVARQLLESGQLGLVWFDIGGRPASVEYNLIGPDTTYTYQGGMEPELLDKNPGHIAFIHTLQWAIDDGHAYYDFLRGDEPYKAQWGAMPVPMDTVRVVADRAVSQVREAAYQAAGNFKDWLKAGWQRVREAPPGACPT